MARFKLEAHGDSSTVGSRLANGNAGGSTIAASWSGAIETEVYVDQYGRDCYRVVKMSWPHKDLKQELIPSTPFDSRPHLYGTKKGTIPMDPGCYAANEIQGYDGVRRAIARLVLDTFSRIESVGPYPTLYQLHKALLGPMSDDDSETTAALEWLNTHTIAGYWELRDGDLMLVSSMGVE